MYSDGKSWPESFDSYAWADAFLAQMKLTPEIATDREVMMSWFANAIMRGYDQCKTDVALLKREPQ